jgi:hypothetical protein
MDPVTRRSFLVTGSAGALGVAGAAAMGVRLPLPGTGDDAEPDPTAEELADMSDLAVLNIRDAQTGELELLVGERSVVFTDRRLVARLIRASRAQ